MIVFLRNLNNKEKINVINALYDKSPVMPIFYDYRKPINRIVISAVMSERLRSIVSKPSADTPGIYGAAVSSAISNSISSIDTKYTLNSMVGKGADIMFDPKIPGDSCIYLGETKFKELLKEKTLKLESEMGAEFLFVSFISRDDVAAAITNKSSVVIIDEPDENIIEFVKKRDYKIVFFNKSNDKIEESEKISVFSSKKEITHSDASILFESTIDPSDNDFDFVKEVIEKENEKIVKFKIIENTISKETNKEKDGSLNGDEEDEKAPISEETTSEREVGGDQDQEANVPLGHDRSLYEAFRQSIERMMESHEGVQTTDAA